MQTENEKVPQGAVSDIVNVATKLTRWKTYAIYGLLAVVAVEGIALLWMRGSVATAKEEVVRMEKEMLGLKTERDMAKTNENSCRVNLDQQNNDIADAGKRYKKLQAEFDQLQHDIDSGKYYKPADDVKRQPTPKTCEETLDFLNRNFP